MNIHELIQKKAITEIMCLVIILESLVRKKHAHVYEIEYSAKNSVSVNQLVSIDFQDVVARGIAIQGNAHALRHRENVKEFIPFNSR
jgi:hypothetical protein